MFDWIIFIFILIVGFGAGLVGSMVGIGGGIFITPVLTIMGLPPYTASSTSLFAVFSTSVSSSISYHKQRKILFDISLRIALASIPGSIIGAILSSIIEIHTFRFLFAIILIASGIYILIKKILPDKQQIAVKNLRFFDNLKYLGLSFIGGVISSLFGVGGGIIFVPMMLIIFNIPMKYASPTSQFALLLTSLSGIVIHSLFDHSNYDYAIILSIGAFFGAQVGSNIAKRMNNTKLQKILSAILFIVAIKFLLDVLLLLI